MEDRERTETEKLRESPKVRRALGEYSPVEQHRRAREPMALNREKTALWVFGAVFIAAGVLYYLFRLEAFPIRGRFLPLLQNLMAGTMLVTVVLVASRLLKSLFRGRIENPSTRYNLRRIVDLAAALLIFFIFVSILFVNWYAAVVSLGVASLILGLALQNPISSFFGWVYILIRRPYEVGDRIKIGGVSGDVIELGYLDTTLWEFNGDYLTGDHPSGRIIRFANSRVFSEYVINYSWPLFPYIWNEVKFFVSYESDLKWVRKTARKVVQEEIGPEMARRVGLYRQILRESPVDEVEVRARGSVSFSAHDNTWIQVTVRFLVEPKQSGPVKRRLFTRLVEELSSQPERVMFPKTNMR
ncbi:small-conductance mechanosensitive channel [Pontibacter aydingkolensis]|uniref:mechanosensitive ion channel family protein n=1 Tax=Pontibacter aydingkolensis TaxID=1911536 RepID=UPI001FE6C486|nr:mechanosensitive ion channel domain-containing protein [Pontibacter aydingkolensis]